MNSFKSDEARMKKGDVAYILGAYILAAYILYVRSIFSKATKYDNKLFILLIFNGRRGVHILHVI